MYIAAPAHPCARGIPYILYIKKCPAERGIIIAMADFSQPDRIAYYYYECAAKGCADDPFFATTSDDLGSRATARLMDSFTA